MRIYSSMNYYKMFRKSMTYKPQPSTQIRRILSTLVRILTPYNTCIEYNNILKSRDAHMEQNLISLKENNKIVLIYYTLFLKGNDNYMSSLLTRLEKNGCNQSITKKTPHNQAYHWQKNLFPNLFPPQHKQFITQPPTPNCHSHIRVWI